MQLCLVKAGQFIPRCSFVLRKLAEEFAFKKINFKSPLHPRCVSKFWDVREGAGKKKTKADRSVCRLNVEGCSPAGAENVSVSVQPSKT